MSVFHNNALIGSGAGTGAAAAAEYVIPKSLRFNSGDSPYLSRTPSSAGNRRTWTWSGWVKRSNLTSGSPYGTVIFSADTGNAPWTAFQFESSDATLQITTTAGSSTGLKTNAVFRDVSAWYHLVIAFDTTQSTASDRVKCYVNGVAQTFSNSNYPAQNSETKVNGAFPQYIGFTNNQHFDGLIADVQLVDGQQLAPTDFGETRSSDGVWVPKEFTGFGTNPNNGTTWSSTYSGAFAGNAMTDSALVGSYCGLNSSITITLAESVTVSSSLKLNLYASVASFTTYTTISINGTDQTSNMSLVYSTGTNSGVWEVTGFTGTLSSIGLGAQNGANNGLARVIVDNNTLLNGAVDNSFHLNFSDSSTNEALGFDSAPTIPDADPKKGMDVITYTGNGGAQNIGGLNFEPGLIWLKRRNASAAHALFDSIRGVTKVLESSNTGAEKTNDPALASFNPDGFSLNTSSGQINASSATYVAWMWRAGGPAVSNSDGTITSQVSANTDYGFSIATWTGNATAGATIGHGLSSTPKWIIVKARGLTENWPVFHSALGGTKALYLDLNLAQQTSSQFWNNTAPTSSVFSLGSNTLTNSSSSSYVAYIWSEVSGYSKFGSYTGGGSTDVTVDCGFKPKLVIAKNADGAFSWYIADSERATSNPFDELLYANTSEAETTSGSGDHIRFTDTGFVVEGNANTLNQSGSTFVFAAFAERPGNNWDVNNIVTNEGLTTSKTQFDVVTYTGNGNTAQKIGGAVFSAGATATGGFNSSYPATNLFNGTLSDSSRAEGNDNDGVIEVVFSPGITVSSTVGIWSGKSSVAYQINDSGSYTTYSDAVGSFKDISFTGTLTNLKIKHGSSGNAPGASGIRVDGTTLLDGTQPGLKFQPDFVWIKGRNAAAGHLLMDSVRGAGNKTLTTNGTGAEGSETYGQIQSFDSNGFTVEAGSTSAENSNYNNRTYVAWCWKAGGTAVSNTDGSITSSVSANAAYGFSIVSYTGTNANATVGHGLNSQPQMIIVKSRDASQPWVVGHSGIGFDKYLWLNSTNAEASLSTVWQDTAPTSSVFSIGATAGVNGSGDDYVAYCFANVPGYQRIGTYYSDSSDPTVITGFKPRFLLTKKTSAGSWTLHDSQRDFDDDDNRTTLEANKSQAEETHANKQVKFLDNGFQLIGADMDTSNTDWIYLAIGDDEIGSDEDCLVDVPNAVTADADATDTTGGYQRGNYCTLNPLHTTGMNGGSGAAVLSNGNLEATSNTSAYKNNFGTITYPAAGKYYFEVTVLSNNGTNNQTAGIAAITGTAKKYLLDCFATSSTSKRSLVDSSATSLSGSFNVGDVIGVAVDCDAGTAVIKHNGIDIDSGYTLDSSVTYAPFFSGYNCGTSAFNFGQMRFKYPMPSGYAALNTTALPAATIADGSDHFDAILYTGDGNSTQAITAPFEADLIWNKTRSGTTYNRLFDSVRGLANSLYSGQNFAENAFQDYGYITATSNTSLTVGQGTDSGNLINVNGRTYVNWIWNAGSSTVSNTDGSITSSVRANPSAGFSIITFTAPSSSTASYSVGHGLNVAPEFWLWKSRSAAGSWQAYFTVLGSSSNRLNLDSTGSLSSSYPGSATNSIINLSDGPTAAWGGTNVIYAFTPVAGYSSFGSYEGNSSTDGPFVYTGFRPRWIMYKWADGGGEWAIRDTARSTYNVSDQVLTADSNGAEQQHSVWNVDILSNGFKIRTSSAGSNSSSTFIYAAFAENPFQANGGLAR